MAGKVATGGGKKGQTQPVVDPNVIPFIDIMLVLLIIFMVTAPTPTVDVRVDLPPPNPIAMPTENRPTFVYVQDNGTGQVFVTVDGEQTTLEQLADKVLERIAYNAPTLSPSYYYRDAPVFVRADQTAAYGNVVRVMSRLKEEGFAKVSIFAERAQF